MEYTTKSDILYENLKDKILSGRLKPGVRLVVADIASEYDVSPMPVREALKRLQQEDLIEVTPHVGAKVKSVDMKKFNEILQVRVELEPIAAKMAACHVTDNDIEILQKMNDMMAEAAQKEDTKKYSDLNTKFHEMIYGLCGNNTLLEVINELWEKTERTKSIFSRRPQRMISSIEEHQKIVDGLKARDPEQAYLAFRNHKLIGFDIVEKCLVDE